MRADELRERLQHFVAAATNADRVSIDGLRKLPGGASRQTWALDAVYSVDGVETRLPLVLRRDPGSTTSSNTSWNSGRSRCALAIACSGLT